jgi:hypothetical protein
MTEHVDLTEAQKRTRIAFASVLVLLAITTMLSLTLIGRPRADSSASDLYTWTILR